MAREGSLNRKLLACGEYGRIPIVEVVMRPAEVFVRPLLHDEAVRLKRLSKRAKHESTRQRAAVLLASNVKLSVADRGDVADRHVVGAQGHPRLQRAWDEQSAPSLPGRASPPDHD